MVLLTTSKNAVLGDLVPSDDPHCVTVTATDYTTRTSDESCFLFNGENVLILNFSCYMY